MKTLFAGYYRPTSEEFDELWKNCIFVFDASVLLDLYRSTAKTRDVVLSILGKIKDHIWLPYQAAWEYQENRLEVIAKERALYSELRDAMDALIGSVQQKLHNHGVESAEKIRTELEATVKKIKEIIDQGASEHPDLMTSDHIRETITELFNGKVGKRFEKKRLEEIYQEGAKRYEQKIPPGYKDAEKGGTRQFGDLVVWMEILEHAKTTKRSVIFITSDTKEDWWWKHGQFTVGPRAELVQEIAAFANVKFYMYNVERFLSEAQKRVETKVELKEVKQAAEEFKEIESKKQNPSEISTHWDKLDWINSITPSDSWSGSLTLMLAQPFLEKTLETESASVATTLSAENWSRIIEILENRKLTSDETSILQGAIDKGTIANFISNTKTLKDAVRRVRMYLYWRVQINSNLNSTLNPKDPF